MGDQVAIVGIVAVTVLGISVLLFRGYMELTKYRFKLGSKPRQKK